MSYSTTKTISLGSANTGLTLAAQLYTSAGGTSGGPISTGFVEIGGGVYLWTGTIADDFQGIVKFTTGAIVVAASINTTDDPGNAGGSSLTAADIWANTDRTLTSGTIVVAVDRQTGSLTLHRGSSRLNADGNPITITKIAGASWPSTILSRPWTVKLRLEPTAGTLATYTSAASLTVTGTVVSTSSVRFDLTAADTTTLQKSTAAGGSVAYDYVVQATSGSSVWPLLESGNATIIDDLITT